MNVGNKILKTGLAEDGVLDLYKEAAKDLYITIKQGDSSRPFFTYRKIQLKKIENIIIRLEKGSRKWVNENIPKIYKAGSEETLKQIKKFKEEQFDFEFGGVNEEAIAILTEEAYNNFGKTMVGLQASAVKATIDLAAVQNQIIKGAIQGSSFSNSQYDVLKNLKAQGFEVLRAKNGFGRRFSLESYSSLLVRSQNIKAYNGGAKNRMLSAGRRFAIFPTITPDIDGEDICNKWERKKIIDLLVDPLPPESTHPNCRHVIRPISFKDLKASYPEKLGQAIKYFEEVAGFTPDF